MRIGLMLGRGDGRPASLDDLMGQAQQAEAAGFAFCAISNIFELDAMTAATVIAHATTRIELLTAAVPIYTRHPYAMAQQALSTAAATGGRFALGIGTAHPPLVEQMWGLSYARPFSYMQEYLAVLRALIETGAVAYRGQELRVQAKLTVPGARPCPILIAALGAKMLALAGREAAGTLTWMTGPKTLREHTVPRINDAAAAAGRPRPRVAAALPIAVTTDVAAARTRANRVFATYGTLPSYRAMLDLEGAAGPGDVVIAGDADAVAEQLAALAASGVTDFTAAPFPVGPDAPASLACTLALLARLAAAGGTPAPSG